MTQATAGLGIKDLHDRHGWITPFCSSRALAAIVGSLCIGAYPMSFWRAGEHRDASGLAGSAACESYLDGQGDHRSAGDPAAARAARRHSAGLALGISGTALQGMMRNPLVGPDLVGVTSGAAFGGVLAILLDLPPAGIIACAFCGGLLAMSLTFSWRSSSDAGINGISLILAGVFFGAFFMALIGLIEISWPRTPNCRSWFFGCWALLSAPMEKRSR